MWLKEFLDLSWGIPSVDTFRQLFERIDLAQIKPNERDDVAHAFFKHLKQRGLDDRHLEQQLGLSTHNPNRMSADDVSKLASFTYHSHPDIFHDVLAEQPAIMKFISNPLIGAAMGVIASKWFGGHK